MSASPERISRYQIVAAISQDWTGTLYRAVDPLLERDVVVKVMEPDTLVDGSIALSRFLEEAQAAARLQHRNIVTTFDYGEENGVGFLVREFLRGQSLASRVKSARPQLSEALDIVADVCAALEFAHDRGVVHRDVKPTKIWLGDDGTVKLIDFGIVRSGASTLINYRELADSVGYMAPELIAGEDVDGRADLFSLGAVLYELVAREPAFGGGSAAETMERLLHESPRSLESLVPDLPPGLGELVASMLKRHPGARVQSASDLAADLHVVRQAIQPAADTVVLDRGVHTLPRSVDVATDAPAPDWLGGPFTPDASRERHRTGSRWRAAIALGVVVAAIAALALPRLLSDDMSAEPPPPPVAKQIEVRSEPADAAIFVDGRDTGLRTPGRIDLPATDDGPALIRLGRAGYDAEDHAITPEEIERGNVELKLRPVAPEPQFRLIAEAPSDSRYPFEVRDGNGRTRLSPLALRHELMVFRGRGVRLVNTDYFLNWAVPPEQLRTGLLRPPALGLLQVIVPDDAAWAGCSVWLDGQDFGHVLDRRAVASGPHTLEFKCPAGTKVVPEPDVVVVEPGSDVTQKKVG